MYASSRSDLNADRTWCLCVSQRVSTVLTATRHLPCPGRGRDFSQITIHCRIKMIESTWCHVSSNGINKPLYLTSRLDQKLWHRLIVYHQPEEKWWSPCQIEKGLPTKHFLFGTSCTSKRLFATPLNFPISNKLLASKLPNSWSSILDLMPKTSSSHMADDSLQPTLSAYGWRSIDRIDIMGSSAISAVRDSKVRTWAQCDLQLTFSSNSKCRPFYCTWRCKMKTRKLEALLIPLYSGRLSSWTMAASESSKPWWR